MLQYSPVKTIRMSKKELPDCERNQIFASVTYFGIYTYSPSRPLENIEYMRDPTRGNLFLRLL